MSVTDVTGRFPIPLKWPRLAMDMSRVDAVVIHHTAVDPQAADPEVGPLFPAANMTVEDELNHIAVIHLYHKSRGFLGFGYHLIVFPSGRAYLVTSLWQWGAHVAGKNDSKWGIAFAGDFTSRLPGVPQVMGGREAVQFCFELIGEELPINPHKAYGGTACPGRLTEILQELVPSQEDDMAKLIQGSSHIYVTDGLHKRRVPGPTLAKELISLLGPVAHVSDDLIAWLSDADRGVPGVGAALRAELDATGFRKL